VGGFAADCPSAGSLNAFSIVLIYRTGPKIRADRIPYDIWFDTSCLLARYVAIVLALRKERIYRWLACARSIWQAGCGQVLVGAQVRLIIGAQAALLQSSAGPKIVRGSDRGFDRYGHGRANVFIARRMPLLDLLIECRVKHVGFEAPPHVAFTTEYQCQ